MVSEYQKIERRISEALEWRKQQPKPPSLTEVAAKFDVPYSRLHRRSKGRNSKSTILNPSRKLTNEQEEAILLYLRSGEDIGLLPTVTTLTAAANAVLQRSHHDPLTPPLTVGKNWSQRFIQRHPELSIARKREESQIMKAQRQQVQTEEAQSTAQDQLDNQLDNELIDPLILDGRQLGVSHERHESIRYSP